MQKSFITATPDSGSGNGTVTCSASQNNTENSRSTSITVSGGGLTRTVSISQAAGTVTYGHYSVNIFSAVVPGPDMSELDAAGGSVMVCIASTMKKYINGGNAQDVAAHFTISSNSGSGGATVLPFVTFDETDSANMTYTAALKQFSTGISWTRNGRTVARTCKYYFTNKVTGSTVGFTFGQKANSVTPGYTLTANTGGAVWYAAYIGTDNSVPGAAQSLFTGMTKSGNNFIKQWAGTLSGYDFSQSQSMVTQDNIMVGGTFYIRFTQSSESWTAPGAGGRVYGPFTLQNGSQTVNCY
jgi:hypothetical protein